MLRSKKLYWLEYSDVGPMYITKPFAAVGFQTKAGGWTSQARRVLTDYCLHEISAWEPDVIVLWIGWLGGKYLREFIEVPLEWLEVYGLIRKHPRLQHCKIIIFMREGTVDQVLEVEWRKTCDVYIPQPLKWIEHAKLAKRLLGEETSDIEGVNYYLTHNGTWTIYADLMSSVDRSLPDAEGRFARSPRTRILTTNLQTGLSWTANGVQAERPTSLVYVVKNSLDWQSGLGTLDIERLERLASKASPDHQLLIGANDVLLRAGLEAIIHVNKQAQLAGGWQIFINEHMWFERIGHHKFEEVLYESDQAEHPQIGPVVL